LRHGSPIFFLLAFVRNDPGRAPKILRPRRVRAHSHSRDTLTSPLPHSRHVFSLPSYVRKLTDHKVNKENGAKRNFISNLSIRVITQIRSELIRTKRTSFFIILHCLFRAQISFSALKALQRNTAPLLLRLSSRQSRLLELFASSCISWTVVPGF